MLFIEIIINKFIIFIDSFGGGNGPDEVVD